MSTQKRGAKTRVKAGQNKTQALEDENAALEAKMLELEVQLQKKSECLFDIVKTENLLRQKLLDYKEDLREDKERRLAVCANLVRQHKALQLSYTDQLNAEHAVLDGQKRELSERTNLMKQVCANRDKDLRELDACLKAMKTKMDRISEEFGRLLTEIQVVMAHRISTPLDRTDRIQHFSDILESSKAEYFKKVGELIREREEKHTVGTG